MIILFNYIAEILKEQAYLLYQYIPNWYVVVLLFFIFYIIIHTVMELIIKNENEKKEKIVKELSYLKVELDYQNNSKGINSLIIQEPNEKDFEFKEKSELIVKKYKGKPYVTFLAHVVNIFILIAFFWFFKSFKAIAPMNYLPFVTAIIALCTNLTKKKWWLNFIGAVFIAIIFSMLTGAMNVFYLLISIERFIKFILKKRKEKTNKEEENTLEINSDNGYKEN
jgi:hypothetical protein